MAFKLREILEALKGADYVVVGGFAVILHGHLRATRDLDLVIGFAPENVAKACDALSAIGLCPRLPVTFGDFCNPAKRKEWFRHRNMQVFPLWDPTNPERSIDVFVQEPLDFTELMRDSVVKDLDGVPIRVASIAHLIAMKQTAGRRQDLDDIEALRAIVDEIEASRGTP